MNEDSSFLDTRDIVVSAAPSPTIANSQKNVWQCCCTGMSTDSRILTYISTLGISTIIIVFCCYMLSRDLGCTQESVYTGLLTFVLGFWLKNPVH